MKQPYEDDCLAYHIYTSVSFISLLIEMQNIPRRIAHCQRRANLCALEKTISRE